MQPEATKRASANEQPADYVHVGTVEQLYNAVNEPNNEGKTIVLAPGGYKLTRKLPDGSEPPNTGRLELQKDMSLVGGDHPTDVLLEVDPLNRPDFEAEARYGMIRVGRGTHNIQNLTIVVPPEAGAGISTDLRDLPQGFEETTVKISRVTSGDPTYSYRARGVDIRNTGPLGANYKRRLDVVIEDCEFYGGKQGIRIANFQGADVCHVSVHMTGNHAFKNQCGCLIVNHTSTGAVVEVTSNKDRFTKNGVGCAVIGAINSGANNRTRLEANELVCEENLGSTDPQTGFTGGVVIQGASTFAANKASRNTAEVVLTNCKITNHAPADVIIHGAYSRDPAGPAGQLNVASVARLGAAPYTVKLTHSEPPENVAILVP